MVKELLGAWAGLLDATQLPGVLNQGEEGVYGWLGGQLFSFAVTTVPAVQSAISTCDAVAAAADSARKGGVARSTTYCTDFARGAVTEFIRMLCRSVGLDKLIRKLVKAWKSIPAGIRQALDVRNYNSAADLAAAYAQIGLAGPVQVAAATAKQLLGVADRIEDAVLSLVSVNPLGSLLAAGYTKATDLVKRIIAAGYAYAESLINAAFNKVMDSASKPSTVVAYALNPTLLGPAVLVGDVFGVTDDALDVLSDTAAAAAGVVSSVGDAIGGAVDTVVDWIS